MALPETWDGDVSLELLGSKLDEEYVGDLSLVSFAAWLAKAM